MTVSVDDFIRQARDYYASHEFPSSHAANEFFQTFGPGNVLDQPNLPFERLRIYEILLHYLQEDDPEKYARMHKGTPFYFMSWLAFDVQSFEKALFYIDAAISEDFRQVHDEWLQLPAGSFLTLGDPREQVAGRTIREIRQCLTEQINRFNGISGLSPITLDSFINQFVRTLVGDASQRTIVTALYVYLLEFQNRYAELELRSIAGGSIGTFVVHLFRGGLVFESILKYLYPVKDDDARVRALGDVFQTIAFRDDFVSGVRTSADSLMEIVEGVEGDSMRSAFTTTARIRNTTGHNLVWDDVFNDPGRYELLFHQEVNALLYLVSVRFCS